MNYLVILLSNGPNCPYLLWLLTPQPSLKIHYHFRKWGIKRAPVLIAAMMGGCLSTRNSWDFIALPPKPNFGNIY